MVFSTMGKKPEGAKVLTAKERKERWREKMKNDVHSHQAYLQQERNRWKDRKNAGKIKGIADLDRREREAKQKQWREKKRAAREASKALENILPPPTSPDNQQNEALPVDNEPLVVRIDGRRKEGKKRSQRKISKTARELKKTYNELENTKRIANRYKTRANRLRKILDAVTPDTPSKQVKHLLKGTKVNDKVRRLLIHQQAALNDIKKNVIAGKTSLKNVIQFSTVNRYRMGSFMKENLGADKRKLQRNSKKRGNPKVVLDFLKLRIQHFFEDDEISRLTADKKSTIMRGGVKKQRRYLCDTLSRLHSRYQMCNQNFRVSFATVLPPEAVLGSKTDSR